MSHLLHMTIFLLPVLSSKFKLNANKDMTSIAPVSQQDEAVKIEDIDDILKHLYKIRQKELIIANNKYVGNEKSLVDTQLYAIIKPQNSYAYGSTIVAKNMSHNVINHYTCAASSNQELTNNVVIPPHEKINYPQSYTENTKLAPIPKNNRNTVYEAKYNSLVKVQTAALTQKVSNNNSTLIQDNHPHYSDYTQPNAKYTPPFTSLQKIKGPLKKRKYNINFTQECSEDINILHPLKKATPISGKIIAVECQQNYTNEYNEKANNKKSLSQLTEKNYINLASVDKNVTSKPNKKNGNSNFFISTSNDCKETDNNLADFSTKKQGDSVLLTSTVSEKSNFRYLLLEVLKNKFYYRFNITKLLQAPEKCNFKEETYINNTYGIKCPFLAEFIAKTLKFTQNPGKLQKTDQAVYNNFNNDLTELKRKSLINLTVSPKNQTAAEHVNYVEIQKYNKEYKRGLKRIIKSTNFNEIYRFFNLLFGKSVLINEYYDMFVCFMIPLYKISLFFDNNMKGAFEKHLSYPANTRNSFHTPNNVIFNWAIEWLYFFSNYCDMPAYITESTDLFTLLDSFPKDFAISFLFLIYLSIEHETGSIGHRSLNNEQIKRLKWNLGIVFCHPLLFSSTSYSENLKKLFICINNVFSKKIYQIGATTKIWLIRTTTENIQFSKAIEEHLIPIIDEFYSMVQQALTFNNKIKYDEGLDILNK